MNNMSFQSIYKLTAAVPALHLGDPAANACEITRLYQEAVDGGASIVVFPELCVTGYTCGDLFEHRVLLAAALDALKSLRDATEGSTVPMLVGLPLLCGTRLFDCAAVLQDGRVAAFVGKTYLPEYREFYEKRQFRSIMEHDGAPYDFDGDVVPLGSGFVFQAAPDFRFGVELSEDLCVITPPCANMALNGAHAILNLSAGPELVGSANYRRNLVASQSARLSAAYLLAGAGVHESTSDLVFSGHSIIAINGHVQAENRRFDRASNLLSACFVPRWMDEQRRAWTSFNDAPRIPAHLIPLASVPQSRELAMLPLPRHPFVPEDADDRAERCDEILNIQAAGLAQRVEVTHASRLVIGLSGGLDSTLALLVCAKCCDLLGKPHDFILSTTMPGMGTSGRTYGNAIAIAHEIGAELREIDIKPAVMLHFKDIGHDPECLNVVYENAQARERTQILMDIANGVGGLLVGTADLSEIALGWSTYNGDHMSMYDVNCGVPKTLVRFIVEHVAAHSEASLANLLRDVNATPVSPELLPGQQHTETILGIYDLHDFFLYFFLKYAESPDNLFALACQAFSDIHSADEIRNTLAVFVRRFFSQQFKRNAIPDGPKVGTIALSPRGDWRMPADITGTAWKNNL